MKTLTRLMMLAPLVLVGCAGTTASTARMGATQAAIRSAGEVGAEHEPTAALHLQYAREQFTQAEQLSRNGEGERAERVLARAEADAELALALSRRATSIAAAQQAATEVRAARAQPTPSAAPQPTPPAPQPTP
jgi:hypothetical protein